MKKQTNSEQVNKKTQDAVSRKRPEKSLTAPLKRKAGRSSRGNITIRHRGGGAKRIYRIIDFKQTRYDMPAKVLSIEYDPNRTAHIALIQYEDGEKSYILAPEGLKIDQIITSSKGKIKANVGDRMTLANIPLGSFVYNVELIPGRGGQIVKSAGSSATVLAKDSGFTNLKMPSGEVRMIKSDAMASIGQVSNSDHGKIVIGKAGRKRHMGIRPTVRGKAMNPVDHPHGGGEGKHPIGLKHPKTPWGAPALGYKTRRKKLSDRFILSRRKGKK